MCKLFGDHELGIGFALICLAPFTVAAWQAPASAVRNPARQVIVHGPSLRTDRGNHSFRGLTAAVGQTTRAIDIVIRNDGDSPLTELLAATHGDFVITGSSCPPQLPAVQDGNSSCVVSVAFQPSSTGARAGDLTISASGVAALVVPLDAGTPIKFGAVPLGETSLEWVQLSASAPLRASVTGPFAIALQSVYAYGSIDGVTFAPSSFVLPSSGPVSLGVRMLAAMSGDLSGTVTVSDGSIYSLSASVAGHIQLLPVSADFRDVSLRSISGKAPFTFTNGSSSSLPIVKVESTAPFSATSNCGNSLGAGASCTIGVVYFPTATGPANGQLTVSTGSGDFVASLAGTSAPNGLNIAVDPSVVFLNYTGFGDVSPLQNITVTNFNSNAPIVLDGMDTVCSAPTTGNCFELVANSCATLAPLGSCQIQLRYVFGIPQGPEVGNFNLVLARGNSHVVYSIYYEVTAPKSASSFGSILVTPASLTFPPTQVGQISEEQRVTATNISALPIFIGNGALGINPGAPQEFSADAACGMVAPGADCTFHVRYLPLRSGSTSQHLGVGGFSNVVVHGYGIPTTSLASPSYPPLLQPVINAGPAPDGTPFKFTLPVKNSGAMPLRIADIFTSATLPQVFTVDPGQCPLEIAPAGECTVQLTWNPKNCASGWGDCYDIGTLTVMSNAESSPDTYSLDGVHYYSGMSTGSLPSELEPINIYFGRVQMGIPAVQTRTFNGAVSPIPAVSVTGSGFRLTNGCAGLAGSTSASCSIQVEFAPISTGFAAGTLKLVSKTGLATGTLSGAGIPLQLRVSPAVVRFPTTLIYQSPSPQVVTITNITAAPLALSGLYTPQYSLFPLVGTTCGASLSAGGSCSITVAFTPYNNVGLKESSVSFSFGADDGMQTIPLAGSVTSLVISPSSLDFGTVSAGQIARKAFTVQNVGAGGQEFGTATIQGATIGGANAANFTVSANTCTAGTTLAGSQTCNVTVQFDPTASGVRRAVLTVASGNAGSVMASLVATGKIHSKCDAGDSRDRPKESDHDDCDCDRRDRGPDHRCHRRDHRHDDRRDEHEHEHDGTGERPEHEGNHDDD